ncbi:hypothetical protein GH5_01522 [Leishmania sp. Ghana 2012 LV757]|uniref:hypothetical protein n=1 Tax=Leishmania sp. Ghana 2012 LV757 TaxID=2803181 RepID=UPI001B6BE6B7|nr:hypothetical protein GH5_01522 [Leishmania sp. Ghana 2012 LV757]
MALRYSAETLRAQGIGSPFASLAELYIPDPANASRRILDTARTTLQWSELPGAFLNIKAYQDKLGVGCSGWGMDLSLLSVLFPTMCWFLGIALVRCLCREPLARFGIYMGVVTENSAFQRLRDAAGMRGTASLSSRHRKRLMKFQNQVFLSMFYIISSCFGYYVQRDQPWFKLPLDDEASLHLILPHPYNPPKELLMYYQYSLAFYFSELCSLFLLERHVKRSDFLEYTAHHLATVLLILCSHIGLEHRFGTYVLFIHDASDIMLSVSKSLHYMSQGETVSQEHYNKKYGEKKNGRRFRQSIVYRYIITKNCVNCCFAAFAVFFFFFRLYCLPLTWKASIRMAKVRHGNFNMWMLVFLLNVALQGLHVYWAILIIAMVRSLITGGERKDIRSDDEKDVESPSRVLRGAATESDDDTDPHGGKSKRKRTMSAEARAASFLPSPSATARNGAQRRSSSKRKQ